VIFSYYGYIQFRHTGTFRTQAYQLVRVSKLNVNFCQDGGENIGDKQTKMQGTKLNLQP